MRHDEYRDKYFPDRSTVLKLLFAPRTAAIRRLKDVWEVPDHPPWDKFLKMRIVEVNGNYVLIGSAMCNFIDGQALRWFEIAVYSDKDVLKVWKDLHCAA